MIKILRETWRNLQEYELRYLNIEEVQSMIATCLTEGQDLDYPSLPIDDTSIDYACDQIELHVWEDIAMGVQNE